MSERFKLNRIEANTPLWYAIRAHYEQRLSNLRSQNDSITLDPIKTAELRGRISEVKAFLQIDKPDKTG